MALANIHIALDDDEPPYSITSFINTSEHQLRFGANVKYRRPKKCINNDVLYAVSIKGVVDVARVSQKLSMKIRQSLAFHTTYKGMRCDTLYYYYFCFFFLCFWQGDFGGHMLVIYRVINTQTVVLEGGVSTLTTCLSTWIANGTMCACVCEWKASTENYV